MKRPSRKYADSITLNEVCPVCARGVIVHVTADDGVLQVTGCDHAEELIANEPFREHCYEVAKDVAVDQNEMMYERMMDHKINRKKINHDETN